MGQQQLLLIVLGVIIVGVAVVVGIAIYNANAKAAEIDNLTSIALARANLVFEYYKKPVQYGGGGGTFQGWLMPYFEDGSEPQPMGDINFPDNTFGATFTTREYILEAWVKGRELFSFKFINKYYGDHTVPGGFTIIVIVYPNKPVLTQILQYIG